MTESLGGADTPEQPSIPAGWYRNPDGPGRRYWDGSAWTSHWLPDEERVSPGGGVDQSQVAYWGALAAITGIVLGSIGPWVTAVIATKNGLDGDGVITIVLGGIAALAFLQQRSKPFSVAPVGILLGALAIAVAGYDIIDIYNTKSSFLGQEVQIIRPGWGLWLTAIGAVGLIAASLSLRRQRPATT